MVDPQRDIGRVLALTEPRDLRITHAFETHIHNDYVTAVSRSPERPVLHTTSTLPIRSASRGSRSAMAT